MARPLLLLVPASLLVACTLQVPRTGKPVVQGLDTGACATATINCGGGSCDMTDYASVTDPDNDVSTVSAVISSSTTLTLNAAGSDQGSGCWALTFNSVPQGVSLVYTITATDEAGWVGTYATNVGPL